MKHFIDLKFILENEKVKLVLFSIKIKIYLIYFSWA